MQAYYNLGILYRLGRWTIPQNKHLMFQAWLEAALNNYPPAQGNIGFAYSNGLGVAPDLEAGYYRSVIAAERGNKIGQENREKYHPDLSPAQILRAEKRASDFLAKTARKQSSTQDKQAGKQPTAPRS